MLIGRVTPDKEAVIPMEVLGANGLVQVEAMIDTGYNGFLTLPKMMIEKLGLTFVGPARAALGDGNEVTKDLFLAAVPMGRPQAFRREERGVRAEIPVDRA